MEKHLSRLVRLVGVCGAHSSLRRRGPCVQAPELDPGTATSGVTLLVGGALFLIERYRRRR